MEAGLMWKGESRNRKLITQLLSLVIRKADFPSPGTVQISELRPCPPPGEGMVEPGCHSPLPDPKMGACNTQILVTR